ncbi:MAG: Maf family nucleotide pyrophosphatase [Methylophilaceae bacterium]|jgi:septum formation protein|nr:Maf family nucleotide pyrophosphatase [Methylophilaceae bacterium]
MYSIILASSSIYRKQLLERLTKKFKVIPSQVDEKKLTNEGGLDSALRLATLKAQAVSKDNESSYIIGSDQTAEYDSIQIEKPKNIDESFQQLIKLSGKDVTFYSAVCLINKSKNVEYKDVETIHVKYKVLTKSLISTYLDNEMPNGCLGSIKSEGLGVTLLDKIVSNDPSAIIGLPLISLIKMFEFEKIYFDGK